MCLLQFSHPTNKYNIMPKNTSNTSENLYQDISEAIVKNRDNLSTLLQQMRGQETYHPTHFLPFLKLAVQHCHEYAILRICKAMGYFSVFNIEDEKDNETREKLA